MPHLIDHLRGNYHFSTLGGIVNYQQEFSILFDRQLSEPIVPTLFKHQSHLERAFSADIIERKIRDSARRFFGAERADSERGKEIAYHLRTPKTEVLQEPKWLLPHSEITPG
jgi:hypothetical protein